MDDSVRRIVEKTIREELDEPDLDIDDHRELSMLPGWDSVNMSSVMIGLEREYGIVFSVGEIETLSTVANLVGLVADKAKSVSPPHGRR